MASGRIMADKSPIVRVRLDKWLWAARLYKTRSVATDAIARQRVLIAGQRVKPSRIVQIGDLLSVEKGPYVFELTVLGLDDTRRGAPEASQLYVESDSSREKREAIRARRNADREARLGLAGAGRPSKRQRRDRVRLQQSSDADRGRE